MTNHLNYTMHLLIVTESGESTQIDVAEEMQLQDVSALLEAETGVPPSAQALLYNGNGLKGAEKTLKVCLYSKSSDTVHSCAG